VSIRLATRQISTSGIMPKGYPRNPLSTVKARRLGRPMQPRSDRGAG
jgi:hypothetical protein